MARAMRLGEALVAELLAAPGELVLGVAVDDVGRGEVGAGSIRMSSGPSLR